MKRGSGVDNTNRRTWDKSAYGQRASEKALKNERKDGESLAEAKKRKRLENDPLHQGLILQRSYLKPRERSLELAANVGKTQVITANTPLHQQGAFYCSVCDVKLNDSMSYLEHLNGKVHNYALGMSMRVERSTVEQVRARLAMHKKNKGNKTPIKDTNEDLRIEYKQEESEDETPIEKKAKTEKDSESESSDDGLDADAAALMGFSGFGTSKKS